MTHVFVLGAVLCILIYCVDENLVSKGNQLYEKTNDGFYDRKQIYNCLKKTYTWINTDKMR